MVNGANAIAGQLSGQLSAFSNTMLKALNPSIDKFEGANNRKEMLRMSMLGCKTSFLLLAFFFIPAIIEMEYILKYWIKNVPDFTLIFCTLGLLRNLISQLYLPIHSAISAIGTIKGFQISNSLLNICPIIISYILFNLKFEPYFLFIVFIFFSVLNGFNTIYFIQKISNFPLGYYLKNVVFRLLISFIFIFMISYLSSFSIQNSFIKFCVSTFISLMSFSVIGWTVALNHQEKKNILIFFSETKKKLSFGLV